MKILFLCTYYHRAMIFRDMMDRLMALGHEVKAFNAVAKGAKIYEKYQPIMDDAVIHSECFRTWDRYIFHLKQRKIYHSLLKNCNVEKYDCLHSHTLLNGGYVAYRIKKDFGIPYIVSVRNTDINTFLRIPFFVGIANKIVKEASGVQFLSVPYKDKFINQYVPHNLRQSIESKSVVISNGLEDFWLQNKAEAKQLANQKSIKILCVGKIDQNKNLETTVQALNILIKKGWKVKLTVVGQTVQQSVLDRIRQISFVEVIQYLKKEELIEVYRNNDIYIMPSIHETFGRVYAEAMTQGLPVIYSKGQGFDGIFEDGCVGYSVPSKDADYIAQRVLAIMDDYSNISRRCIELCDMFDWNNIAERLNTLYSKAVSRE